MRRALLFALILLVSGCASASSPGGSEDESKIVVTGVVKPLQVTTWQYGSHLLINRQSNQRYALTSNRLNLGRYAGSERVTVRGILIDGYPVDGGPPYIRVLSVSEP